MSWSRTPRSSAAARRAWRRAAIAGAPAGVTPSVEDPRQRLIVMMAPPSLVTG
ncbi:autoinducer binding domain-containing protein [Mycobacterium branderi]|nr:autoinducer binding domain-containing protein [Mycobacterium branderi]